MQNDGQIKNSVSFGNRFLLVLFREAMIILYNDVGYMTQEEFRWK